MAQTSIKNVFVYDLNLTWNPLVLWLAKSGNTITQTLQPWSDTQTVRRLVDSGGTEAKRILMFSNLMSKVVRYTHLLRQNETPSFLGVPGMQERSDDFEKTDGRKQTIFRMLLLWTVACYACLSEHCSHLAFQNVPSASWAYSWHKLCLLPETHQSENTFCPQIKYVSNSNMSALHPQHYFPCLLKTWILIRRFSLWTLPLIPMPHPHQPAMQWKMSVFREKHSTCMKSITMDYKRVLTFWGEKKVCVHKSKFGKPFTKMLAMTISG